MGPGSDLEIRGVSALLRSFALLRSTEMSSLRRFGTVASTLTFGLGWGYGQSPDISYGLGPDLDHPTLALAFVPVGSALGIPCDLVVSSKKYLGGGKDTPETYPPTVIPEIYFDIYRGKMAIFKAFSGLLRSFFGVFEGHFMILFHNESWVKWAARE